MDKTAKYVAVFLFALALMVLTGWVYFQTIDAAKERAKLDTFNRTVDLVVENAQEQIFDLPEDGGAWYTTIFVDPDWRAKSNQRSLVAWFEVSPGLRSLKAQTHWNQYLTDSPQYVTKWASKVAFVPCVMVQNSKGKVVYRASGTNIPTHADQLVVDIHTMIEGCCPWKPKPKPNPDTDVVPTPDTNPDTSDVVPDITPEIEKPKTDMVIAVLLGILALLAGVAIPAYDHFKKSFK